MSPKILPPVHRRTREQFVRFASHIYREHTTPQKPAGSASQLHVGLYLEERSANAKQKNGRVKNIIDTYAHELFKLHREGRNEFRDLKLLGDAALQLHVFAHLRYKGQSGNSKNLSLSFLSNREIGALVVFFRQQLGGLYVKHYCELG